MINLPMILIEQYTLNPAASRPRMSLVELFYGRQGQRYYTIATKYVTFGATEGPRYYTIATINEHLALQTVLATIRLPPKTYHCWNPIV